MPALARLAGLRPLKRSMAIAPPAERTAALRLNGCAEPVAKGL